MNKDELTRFKIDLGKKIKFVREQKGMTQNELGGAIGKDYQSISRIETGNINSSAFLVNKIAIALGTDVNNLLKPIEPTKV